MTSTVKIDLATPKAGRISYSHIYVSRVPSIGEHLQYQGWQYLVKLVRHYDMTNYQDTVAFVQVELVS